MKFIYGCEDFAVHLWSRTDIIRSNLSQYRNMIPNNPETHILDFEFHFIYYLLISILVLLYLIIFL